MGAALCPCLISQGRRGLLRSSRPSLSQRRRARPRLQGFGTKGRLSFPWINMMERSVLAQYRVPRHVGRRVGSRGQAGPGGSLEYVYGYRSTDARLTPGLGRARIPYQTVGAGVCVYALHGLALLEATGSVGFLTATSVYLEHLYITATDPSPLTAMQPAHPSRPYPCPVLNREVPKKTNPIQNWCKKSRTTGFKGGDSKI